MTDDRWQACALLLERGFKWSEPFAGAHERAYRTLLDGYDEATIATALRRLVASGQVFGPTPGEIIQAIEGDPDRPTGMEAFDLIYGRDGVMAARCTERKAVWESGERDRRDEEARLDRAWELHPLLGAFVESYSVGRLLRLDMDGDHASLVRRDLLAEWDRFTEANAHRDAAALAAGRRRELRRGPQRLDALSAIGAGQPEGQED